MKETPILFNADEVRAILDGRKTQTRRLVKDQETEKRVFIRHVYYGESATNNRLRVYLAWLGEQQNYRKMEHPVGQAGDRLWVRETFTEWPKGSYQYQASTPKGAELGKWKPSIHMPRAASRITLEIVSVRVERLNSISEEDAAAEGIVPVILHKNTSSVLHGWKDYSGQCDYCSSAVTSFQTLWESPKGPGSWDANPWVWVIEFKRIK